MPFNIYATRIAGRYAPFLLNNLHLNFVASTFYSYSVSCLFGGSKSIGSHWIGSWRKENSSATSRQFVSPNKKKLNWSSPLWFWEGLWFFYSHRKDIERSWCLFPSLSFLPGFSLSRHFRPFPVPWWTGGQTHKRNTILYIRILYIFNFFK